MMTAYDGPLVSNGRPFTTLDTDNDELAGDNCGTDNGGWWFGGCSASQITRDGPGIWVPGYPVLDVQASRMLVKFD